MSAKKDQGAHMENSGDSGEIILPAEVTEGKVWTYEGPTPICTNDSRQQGGRR